MRALQETAGLAAAHPIQNSRIAGPALRTIGVSRFVTVREDSMTIVYGALALAGLYPLGVAWRANRGTSLRYAIVWTVASA